MAASINLLQSRNCQLPTCLTGPVVLCMSYVDSYELGVKDDLRQPINFINYYKCQPLGGFNYIYEYVDIQQ
jgi:hypothetical protein